MKEHYFRTSDGLRLYYRDYPNCNDKTPVVCLPGLTRNSRDFAPLADWICEQRRVICPDLRGRGNSEFDSNWKNYHPAQYVADLWILFEQLGIDEAILIGTSLGGWMSMLMAQEKPGKVAAVIMNDIGPETNPAGIERITNIAGRLDKVATFAEAVEQVRRCYEIAFPDWSDTQWRSYTESTYRETPDGRFDLSFDRNIGHAVRQGVSGLRTDPWKLFDSLRGIPTLVIHGELSDILTNDIVAKMQSRVPGLLVTTVSNRGHAPLLDEPEAVDAISDVLQKL